MIERVKLIWDFRGPNAAPIAKHHAKHLGEFAQTQGLKNALFGFEIVSEMHHIAYLVAEKTQMEWLRETLKPNRGQLYKEL